MRAFALAPVAARCRIRVVGGGTGCLHVSGSSRTPPASETAGDAPPPQLNESRTAAVAAATTDTRLHCTLPPVHVITEVGSWDGVSWRFRARFSQTTRLQFERTDVVVLKFLVFVWLLRDCEGKRKWSWHVFSKLPGSLFVRTMYPHQFYYSNLSKIFCLSLKKEKISLGTACNPEFDSEYLFYWP